MIEFLGRLCDGMLDALSQTTSPGLYSIAVRLWMSYWSFMSLFVLSSLALASSQLFSILLTKSVDDSFGP